MPVSDSVTRPIGKGELTYFWHFVREYNTISYWPCSCAESCRKPLNYLLGDFRVTEDNLLETLSKWDYCFGISFQLWIEEYAGVNPYGFSGYGLKK